MKRTLHVEGLEDRRLCAVTWQIVAGDQYFGRKLEVQGTPAADTIGLEPGKFLTGFGPAGPVYEYGVWIRVTGQFGATFFPNSAFDHIVVRAGEGNDRVTNNSARPSHLFGEGGHDLLVGGSGEDALFGGSDNDTAVGGLGSDFLFGERGRDELYGDTREQWEEFVPLGGGNDFLWGGAGDDLIFGGSGTDFLFGGDPVLPQSERRRDHTINSTTPNQSSDQLYGQQGMDFLNGGGGFDILDGGADYDVATSDNLAMWFDIEGMAN
jgi:Ca2+-binding RTX toxin-like protein